jgi:hypothetical protein
VYPAVLLIYFISAAVILVASLALCFTVVNIHDINFCKCLRSNEYNVATIKYSEAQ